MSKNTSSDDIAEAAAIAALPASTAPAVDDQFGPDGMLKKEFVPKPRVATDPTQQGLGGSVVSTKQA